MTKHKRPLDRPATERVEPDRVESDRPEDPPVVTEMTPLAARMLWFFFGPMVLMLTLWGILSQRSGWITVLDAIYLVAVLAMIGARWIEQRSGQAMTGTGQPSTWRDFRRYAAFLVPLTAGAWFAANLVGNHLLDGTVE